MALGERYPAPYLDAISRGFRFATETGRRCGPLHFLVGISEGGGPAAAALDPGPGRSLRAAVTAAGGSFGDGATYLHVQAQGAAGSLAESLGQPRAPGHLLIALLDQGTPDVLRALALAGLDPAAVRESALAAVGAPPGLPPAPLPPLTAAGALDRPALPVAELDERAWRVLRWRQEHLPLSRVHGRGDARALASLESRAAWRLAERLDLGDDQRHSLLRHHGDEVSRRVLAARPGLATLPRRPLARHRHPLFHGLAAGWAAWLDNRRTGLRDRWFRLRTLGTYRGVPQP